MNHMEYLQGLADQCTPGYSVRIWFDEGEGLYKVFDEHFIGKGENLYDAIEDLAIKKGEDMACLTITSQQVKKDTQS